MTQSAVGPLLFLAVVVVSDVWVWWTPGAARRTVTMSWPPWGLCRWTSPSTGSSCACCCGSWRSRCTWWHAARPKACTTWGR